MGVGEEYTEIWSDDGSYEESMEKNALLIADAVSSEERRKAICRNCKVYWYAICEDCYWSGCSEELHLVQYEAGDADVECPECGSTNIEDFC